jgi:hypothetical protein
MASAPDLKSTDEEDQKDDREDDEICYFSEYGDTGDEEKPRGVYEVTPKLASGSTTRGHQAPASPSPECTSVQQELPEEAQEQETKVARGHPGQGSCGEAECDRADG